METGTTTETTTTTTGIDFSTVTLPFGANDLLSSATGLMGVFGGFILLGLAVYFAPKLISLIRTAAATRSSR